MRGTVFWTHWVGLGQRCIPAHAGNGARGVMRRGYTAVHPRACGERLISISTGSGLGGASPRMRGTAHGREPGRSRRRCIPAHAGNGYPHCDGCPYWSVHPRACGERGVGGGTPVLATGASPRMRGTVHRALLVGVEVRCIPAHAGNGFTVELSYSSLPVHPRACGERGLVGLAAEAAEGASPRMRGTVVSRTSIDDRHRCIPAHAGNGLMKEAGRAPRAVHPRACGERCAWSSATTSIAGASPRMRGTVLREAIQPTRLRCIPAHAGNGSWAARRSSWKAVHPRACGERFKTALDVVAEGGASPRMRGTEQARARADAIQRCIPAHAGNGAASPAARPTSSVHPRACGERCISSSAIASGFGASPRMRGTADLRHRPRHRRRCIPAHAGNGQPSRYGSAGGAVHPRACGERSRSESTPSSQSGASPRMRGTARQTRRPGNAGRCIPAHAGNGSPSTTS